jgi:Uma2 family endonuclease
MQTLREIVLPQTTPETEWIGARAVRKVMPTTDHSILQLAFAAALRDWAREVRGVVGTEWRFRVTIPGVPVHPLVPDVAFMSYDRLRPLAGKDRESPPVAPEIVIEILSPGDRRRDVLLKKAEYLTWGVSLVLIVDSETRSVHRYDGTGRHERLDGALETYTPVIFPNLRLSLRDIFAELEVPPI